MTYKVLETKATRMLKLCRKDDGPVWFTDQIAERMAHAKHVRNRPGIDAEHRSLNFTQACHEICFVIEMLDAYKRRCT